jgi:hypothetical protein
MPLPPGLLLNPQTGEVTGVPTQAGTFEVQLRVRDTLGNQTIVDDLMTIEPYTPMTFVAGYAPMMRTRAYDSAPVVDGGQAPITFSLVGGALPAGVSFDPGTGAITGTPTTVQAYGFTVRATDNLAQFVDLPVNSDVAENLLVAINLPALGTVGLAYASTSPPRTGGTAPFTWSLLSGTLPPGLALDPATGIISGTPTTAGDYTGIALRATDARGFTADTGTAAISVALFPVLSGQLGRGTATRAWVGGSYTRNACHPPYAWSATGLPTGMTIGETTGVISGTPTVPGDYSVQVTLIDGAGNQAQRGEPVTIAANLTLTGTAPAGTRGVAYSFTPATAGGWTPYTYDVSAGSLPLGLTLNASTGRISGTPLLQAVTDLTLRATDIDGNTATLPITIDVAGDLLLTGSTPNRGTTTVAYDGTTYAASGGQTPRSWSIAEGTLPPGLSINTGTGAITGTPTTPGTYNFTVRVTEAGGSFDQVDASITVAAFPALSGTLPDASNGVAYDQGLSASGGHLPLAWDISAGALPDGLSINATTGRITGTPTVEGPFDFTVRITDQAGNVATRPQTITVYALPALSGTLAPDAESARSDGTGGTAYGDMLSVDGGKPNLAFSVSGTLPPGLSINASNGAITGVIGVVTGTGSTGYTDYAFTVRVTDALGRVATSNQTIRVYWRLANTTAPLPAATRTVAYSRALTTQYGKAPVTWAAVSALPGGLSLSSDGVLSGTPTVDGSFAITLRATDALGVTADHAQTLTIYPVVAVSGNAGNGTTTVSFSYTYSRSGGNGSYAWSIVSGALPNGLSLNSSGQIVGTPTVAGTFNFTVRATSAGDTADLPDSIVIAAFPSFTTSYPRGTRNRAYSGTVAASGGHTPRTFSLVSGSLPPGLSLNTSTGAITGTPTANATYSFTVRMTDALGNIVNRAASIAIAPPLSISGSYATPDKEDTSYSSTVSATGGWSPYSFARISGTLPPGTTLASNGTLSGTPNTAGTYNFTVRATDADGNTADKAMTVVIQPATPALSITASPNPSSATAYSNGSNVTATANTLATASGGTGSYTYSATFLSENVEFGAGTATGSTYSGGRGVSVSKTGRFDFSSTQTWRITVNDGVNTASVNVNLSVTIWGSS